MEEFSRRDFFKTFGVGMTLLATQSYATNPSNYIFTKQKINKINIDYVLYDKGVDLSEQFAKKMAVLGSKTFEINKDVSDLYSKVISPTWGKSSDTAIAGLTTYETLFVIQRMAFDKGMVLYYNGEHQIVDNYISHDLKLSKSSIKKIDNDLKKYQWLDAVALNLHNYSYEKSDSSLNIKTINKENKEKNTLYSWIIAPRKVS